MFEKSTLKRLTLLFVFIGAFPAWAEENATAPDHFLTPKMDEMVKSSLKVVREEEGIVFVDLEGSHSFAKDTQILFFRKRGLRLEMIATGRVIGEQQNPKTNVLEMKVDLEKDTIIKYPLAGDFAAPIAEPGSDGLGDKKDQNDYLVADKEKKSPPNTRPGYLEGALGLMYGNLSTTAGTIANNSKKSTGYRFKNTHFAYYSEYFPVGIEYDSHAGNFPTGTFYQEVVTSEESVSLLSIAYRFEPLFNKKLELQGRLSLLNDQFKTNNTDENLLTTKVNGMGVGLRATYLQQSPVWKPKKALIALALQSVHFDFSYFPTLNAIDDGVSRGTSSNGSSGMLMRIGATSLVWLDFVPIFKRFVIQGSYGFRTYSLKFTGPTTPEAVASPVTIPENGESSEKESDFRIFVGIRIEDPIKTLFFSEKKAKAP